MMPVRSAMGIGETCSLLLIGAIIGVACTCPPPVELAAMYAIETDLPDWEPGSGMVLIGDDGFRVVFLDVDGAEWELAYEPERSDSK